MSDGNPITDLAEERTEAIEWTIDHLAQAASLPVRTVREYQTVGLLPGPRRQGRIGLYGPSHLRRLQLVARLRERGYSLAGIADLLGRWRTGSDLGEVLGLEPDQLVHIDEPGAPASPEQLATMLPDFVPEYLDALVATGVLERCHPDRFCIPSPSLVQLAIEARRAGLAPADVLELLQTINRAADTVADEVVHQIAQLPNGTKPEDTAAFLQRSRGLLAHGLGRLTLHRVGSRLGVDNEDVDPAFRQLAVTRQKRGTRP